MRVAKVWLTNHAFTTGIVSVEGGIPDDNPRLLLVKTSGIVPDLYRKPHWHESRADALKYAEELRRKKIAALEKQIDRLLKLRFR